MAPLEDFSLGGKPANSGELLKVDAKGTQCPGPIMALKNSFDKIDVGQEVIIEVTDPGFKNDVVAWCNVTQNTLESLTEENGIITAKIKKDTDIGKAVVPKPEDSVTIVIYDDEMDRGLAAFNIVLGALSMGFKVQVFFTFWGLSLLKKKGYHEEGKSLKERMMEKLLPNDDTSLSLTHKNMFGLGKKMMERIMKEHNVSSLDFMIHLSKYEGVKFIACQMSMDLLDIKLDELIDGVQVGGVATMLEYARKSNINYFL